jgi:hypothetical protein
MGTQSLAQIHVSFEHDHKGQVSRKLSGHYIFSFPKGGKEKDAIPIPHAIPFSEQDYNTKIKAFRSQFKGVRKIDFFLFRLSIFLPNPQLLILIRLIPIKYRLAF